MKLTARQVRALATEMRWMAAGLDDIADASVDESFNYPDDALTVRLFKMVFEEMGRPRADV